MYCEEYGKENEITIVMLHGANFVHCFRKQYVLAEQYHIVVPHLMGYGEEATRIFQVDAQIKELTDFIAAFDQKVILVGFSLGAQLGYRLIEEQPTLFRGAILISPWLCKDSEMLENIMEQNLRQLVLLKKKPMSWLVARMNGLPAKECINFAGQMQNVMQETVRNAVDNGITLENVTAFAKTEVPILALAGEKEPAAVINSVKKMSEINPYCCCQIWEKAAHDIPLRCARRLNEQIEIIAKQVPDWCKER